MKSHDFQQLLNVSCDQYKLCFSSPLSPTPMTEAVHSEHLKNSSHFKLGKATILPNQIEFFSKVVTFQLLLKQPFYTPFLKPINQLEME